MWFSVICTAAATVVLILFLLPLPDLNAGSAAGLAFSAALFALAFFKEDIFGYIKSIWGVPYGRAAVICAGAFLSAAAVWCVVISVRMAAAMNDRPRGEDLINAEPVLIVLGCRVNGRKPSRMLRRRLDTAYGFLKEQGGAKCIVSGGKGEDEELSEAEAMAEYLTAKGISPDRIIKEDRSRSTVENLRNCLHIPNVSEDISAACVIIVTDGFHQYRCRLIAKRLGYGKVRALPSKTNPRYVSIYWVREWFGLLKLMITRDLK